MDYEALAQRFMENLPRAHHGPPMKALRERDHGMFPLMFLVIQRTKCGPITPSEISEELNISTARTAMLLRALEKRGLVERQIDPSDRRKIRVLATKEATEGFRKRERMMRKELAKVFEKMGEKDAPEFLRLAGDFIRYMNESKLHRFAGGKIDCKS
jgi:DNA-binding MarR family transcriptional regulator